MGTLAHARLGVQRGKEREGWLGLPYAFFRDTEAKASFGRNHGINWKSKQDVVVSRGAWWEEATRCLSLFTNTSKSTKSLVVSVETGSHELDKSSVSIPQAPQNLHWGICFPLLAFQSSSEVTMKAGTRMGLPFRE